MACGLKSSGSEEGTVASSREYGNAFSVSTRYGKHRVAGKILASQEEIGDTGLVITLINFRAN